MGMSLSIGEFLMCMFLFSPRAELHLDYVAEAINLENGRTIDLTDILLTCHSREPVDRIHIIYPHAVPVGKHGKKAKPQFEDLTKTWMDHESPYNRYYRTDEMNLKVGERA